MNHTASQGLVLALPPSMGLATIRPVARHLAALLSTAGFTTVWPTRSYAELHRVLIRGEAHAAWAPPALCAHVQRLGGEVAFRALRGGSTSYRSALLCRGERSIDLKRLDGLSRLNQIRAAWVDPRSAAGYLLPRQYLRQRGADLAAVLSERMLGSYQACFDAVLEGDADLTASYVGRTGSGHIKLLGSSASELRVLAWTDEMPNDGVAVSPALCRAQRRRVHNALQSAFRGKATSEELALAFDADGFDVPAIDNYREVSALFEADREGRSPRGPQPAPRTPRARQRRSPSSLPWLQLSLES